MLDGRLFVVGGRECDKCQVFDGFCWRLAAALPAARCGAACLARGGKLVVVGGMVGDDEDEDGSVVCYDPRADAWEAVTDAGSGALPPLPAPRGGCRVAALGPEPGAELVLVGDPGLLRLRDGAWAEVPGGFDFRFMEAGSVVLG